MPMPIIPNGAVQVLPTLSGMAEGFSREETQFIALDVAPVLFVDKKRGNFLVRTRDSIVSKGENLERNQDGSYKKRNSKFEQQGYTTQKRGIEEGVDDEDYEELADNFDFDAEMTRQQTFDILTDREVRVAAACFDETAVPPTGNTGATLATWFTNGSSDLFGHISTGVAMIERRVGPVPVDSPNKTIELVVPNRQVYDKMCINDTIRGKIGVQYNQMLNDKGFIPPAELARVLNIGNVRVGKARLKSSATETKAVWNPNYAGLFVVDRSPTPAGCSGFARTLAYKTDAGLYQAKQYRKDEIDTTFLRVGCHDNVRVFFKDAAYLFKANEDQGAG